ncbi:MAG: elongation factor P [Acidobacteria bacterium]|nr:elongation factor P [Acidobacteriota bacterium]MDA1233922.1 elongation factor P [Acidobacteriota bacterium]
MDVQATQLRAGMLVMFKGEISTVYQVEHRTPGKGRGFVQAKLRNHRSGAISEHKLASSDSFERISLEPRKMEYLYSEGEQYHFMNAETFEQEALSAEMLGGQVNYLIPNTVIEVQFHEGLPFSLALPASVDLEVTETTPAIKGATVTNVTKPATTETGLIVQVPPFIKEGEKIRVSTVDGSYQSRAN